MSTASSAAFDTFSSTLPLSESESTGSARLHIIEDYGDDTIAPAGNKVLLLEDDAAFREIMTDFLQENGFEVTPTQNGVEGVHHVLASDFELILCDLMMPTLPGDMFFRAVERMRPHLCARFVFMTGHRGNQRINDFIDSVSGAVLTKPFRVSDLFEMIDFVRLQARVLMAA
jgi:CheY-like chemotaxis protein